MSSRDLKGFLKDSELDVHPPKQMNVSHRFWTQLASSLDDLIHNGPLLEKIAEELAKKR